MEKPSSGTGTVCFGAFELNLRAGELHKNGRKIRLAEQRFRVLAQLLEHPGEVVTREELRLKLWPADTFVDFDHGLNNAINKIREVLGDSADHPRFIETLPRRGYRFIAPVDGGVVHLPARRSRPQAKHLRWRWGGAMVAGTVAAALALSVALNTAGLRERLLGPPPAAKITSIAVLPLENLTGDPEQEYFVDGIHDELITQLAQISSLKVISRYSVIQIRQQKGKSLREIARELGVEAVMEGTVRRAGERIHLSVQLIRAQDDRHLWARSYERELRDAPRLPSEIGWAMANDLKIRLTPQERDRLAGVRPVDVAAYKAYLKGRYYEGKITRESLYKGIGHYREAIDLDPGYAPAWQGLASCYQFLGLIGHLSPREAYPKAKAAALKALELDDTLARAHLTLGRIKLEFDWDWDGAKQEFERTHELDPNEDSTPYLVLTGQFDQAIAVQKGEIERDPLTPFTSLNLGWNYFMARRYDESIAQLKSTVELDPNSPHPHYELAWNFVKKGMNTEAVAECEVASELFRRQKDIPVGEGDCGWVYAIAGRRAEALRIAQQLERLSQRQWVDPVRILFIYDGLGDRERAIQFMRRAYEERAPLLILLNATPICSDGLRADPRFQDVLRRMNFSQQDTVTRR